jgi:hypothetical protein
MAGLRMAERLGQVGQPGEVVPADTQLVLVVTVLNQGGSSTGTSFDVGLYIDPSQPPTNHTVPQLVGSAAPLDAGATTVVQLNLAAGLPPGSHTLFVLLNPSSSMQEADVSNNLGYLTNIESVAAPVPTRTATPIPPATAMSTPTSAPSGGGGRAPTATPKPIVEQPAALPQAANTTGATTPGGVTVSGVTAAAPVPPADTAPAQRTLPAAAIPDERYVCDGSWFPIDNDTIWDFYTHRGGLAMFGCAISRTFQLQGFTVQFFQRRLVQLDEHGHARLLNVLDPEYLPYTRINGSTFPEVDDQLKARTPRVDSPEYVDGVVRLIDDTVPDEFDGLPVRFHETFYSLVTPAMAGTDDPQVVAMLNLDMWGAPTSRPMYDPRNHNVVYQRFQRAIMSYDAACDCVQAPLLASYLKDILVGNPLPPDLAGASASSLLSKQYSPGVPLAIRDPDALPLTDLTEAFTPH